MAVSDNTEVPWSEEDSRYFIDLGRIYTPSRNEIQETILDLIPAEHDEPFLAVELGAGSGWLSAAVLERFPAARVLGLDGSAAMVKEAIASLRPFVGRFELRQFQLGDQSWLKDLDAVRCFVSSLVVHHLDAAGKQRLYSDLFAHLQDDGAVLIADLIAPASEWECRCLARWYEAEVKRRSLALTGSLDAYQRFVTDRWNWYEHPDPVDRPSTVAEHLQWLAEAGFAGASVFWERAGHAVYGGYKLR